MYIMWFIPFWFVVYKHKLCVNAKQYLYIHLNLNEMTIKILKIFYTTICVTICIHIWTKKKLTILFLTNFLGIFTVLLLTKVKKWFIFNLRVLHNDEVVCRFFLKSTCTSLSLNCRSSSPVFNYLYFTNSRFFNHSQY